MRPAVLNVICVAWLGVAAAPMASAGDLGIAININGEIAPGVYGRVDLTNRAPPPLVYSQPVVIEPAAVVSVEPLYLHVPPAHARNWREHCREYHACNRRVFFVRSAEYEPGYVRGREYRREHRDDREHEHRDDRERRDDREHRVDGHHDRD